MIDDTPARPAAPGSPVIALIAGEASGDLLGGNLIEALRARHPHARFVGVAGPHMRAAGIETWHDIAALSLMGFAEVIGHLPRLLRLRNKLLRQLTALKPDLVIGIDAPDFNLGLERRLKQRGLRTVHYVSPSVWAWREKRAETMARSVDRVLCLFPMEPPIYQRHGLDARFVGHPLASHFPMLADRFGARERMGLRHDAPVLAVLPGSRKAEVEQLGAIFLEAGSRVGTELPGLRLLVPAANAGCRHLLQTLTSKHGPGDETTMLLDGHAHDAMLAADVVLLASGTASLEAMLCKRPMVVGYRVSAATYQLVRALKLIKTDMFALPNILAGEHLVPERMQASCTAQTLATDILGLFGDSARRGQLVSRFEQLHEQLRGGLKGSPADHAADALADLLP